MLGHSLALSGTGTMSTTGVGMGKSLSVGTLSLSGAQSANYTLTGGTHTIDVNQELQTRLDQGTMMAPL